MPRRKPNKIERVVLSLPFLGLASALVILVGISAVRMYQTSHDAEETVNRMQEEKRELSIRQRQLMNTTANLSTERGIEEEIREKFSVTKPGERVIVLVDDPETNTAAEPEKRPWWREFIDFLWPFN